MKPMNFPGRKWARQKAAKARMEIRAGRTAADQIIRLDDEMYEAKRERARLMKTLFSSNTGKAP